MTGDRSKSDAQTVVHSGSIPPDGTVVVAHAADVRSAIPDTAFNDAPTGSHLALIGKQIGPYRVAAELGAGGMGAVYLADQFEPVRRQVALKVIKAGMDSEEVLQRFQSERELLARMNHPNIAQVLDVGATPEGRLYFAMEYVPGVPISEFCDRRGLNLRHRIELFLQVCEGVQHAHQKGVIHRDIKPSNLMVADYEGQNLVKVIDFGIAKSMDANGRGDTGSTRVGVPIGTPAYMSPEQAAGDLAAIDTRTDVYSLGVVLYRLLTHDLPVSSETIARALDYDLARVLREAHVSAPSKKVAEVTSETTPQFSEWKRAMAGDPQTLSRQLRGDLDWITLKAVERERDRRYSSVSEFAADLRRYLQGEAVLASPPSKVYRARKFIARNKLAVAAACAVLVSLVLGIIGTSYMAFEAAAQQQRAEAAMRDAELQRDRAEAESARALAARSFLEEMIAAPDPWKLQGGSPETRNVRVIEAILGATQRIERSLIDQPVLRAEIASMLGRTLRRLGQSDQALPQLQSAVDALRQSEPATAVNRMVAEAELGILMCERGEMETCDSLLQPLLAPMAKEPGISTDLLVETRRAAAVAASGVGDAQRAETLARETLELAEKRVNLGSAVSGAKAALADILSERAAWDEAEQLFTDALTQEQLRLGRAHPVVAHFVALRANLSYRKGDFGSAVSRYREAAAVAEASLGAEHPETLRFRAHAVMALNDSGAVEEAIAEYRLQIPLRARVIGENHPDVLTMRANLANALQSSGQLDAAEAEIEDVFRRRRDALGDTHPDTLNSINMIGVIARQRRDSAKAEVLFRQASELYAKAKGERHPETIMMQANHLAAVRDLGRTEEAINGFSDLLARANEVLPEGHWFRAVIQSHLGLALQQGKQFDRAEPELISAYEQLLAAFGAEDGRTRLFKSRVADLYRAWGKPERANAFE